MKKPRIVLIIVLSVLLVMLCGAGVFALQLYNPQSAFDNDMSVIVIEATPKPTPKEQVVSTETDAVPVINTPEPEAEVDPYEALMATADKDFMKNKANILVLGIDDSTERAKWGSYRTDTMILMTVDFETKDFTMVSLPRDSFVKLPKGNYGKINSAFTQGGGKDKSGFEYAMKAASNTLGGVPVSYYMCVDMNVVKEVVDVMGGVDYNVDVPIKMNGRTLDLGEQHLSGQQVLDYCRQRKGSSDIARVDRQQRMLFALYDKLKSSDQIKNIPDIYSAVSEKVFTNLNLTQVAALAVTAKDFSPETMKRYTLPGDFLDMNGASFWGISNYKLKQMVKEIYGVDITPDPKSDVSILKPYVEQKGKYVGEANSLIASYRQILNNNPYAVTQDDMLMFEQAVFELQASFESENYSTLDESIDIIKNAINVFKEKCAPIIALAQTGGNNPPADNTVIVDNVY